VCIEKEHSDKEKQLGCKFGGLETHHESPNMVRTAEAQACKEDYRLCHFRPRNGLIG